MQTMNSNARRGVRTALGLFAIVALALAVFSSGRIALSRILVAYGRAVSDGLVIDTAISLAPADAETHYARAAVANDQSDPAAALPELELAASLRPRDYAVWFDLGMTRDQLGNQAGALACFNESVRLAPYYAQPHWQRGNLLFRMGRYDEAFNDLRQATTANPDLLPNFIDLAWGASKKNASLTTQIVRVQTGKAHFTLARYLARHGSPDEALAQFRLSGTVSAENKRDLIRELLAAGGAQQAFAVWSSSGADNKPTVQDAIYDGGFEGSLNLQEDSFGWRVAQTQPGARLSLDTNQPHSGSRSLRIDFNGDPGASAPVSQLILVSPGVHYRLSFSVRTKDIVSGAGLTVAIDDAASGLRLASSAHLPGNSGGWQTLSVEFATTPGTKAIFLKLQSENCASAPCPIFGSLNLDSFSLERLK
jgi:Tetratricopeptide repeat